ncbi:MAG TPA: DUF2147 domain-containing protein [Devosiaceae bacterium]|jgi:uncharacterized protein (DUF2147 family)|nr:DUF2147 domain-containing protein [Devosiaceae bacterium]
MHLAKKFAAAALALGLAATPALAADPTGTWQSTTGESRYKVSFCGEGGQLCAQLTWLRDDAKTPETLPYLGKHVMQGAVPTAANRWKGSLSYNGDTYKGSVTMVDANALTLKGCDGIFCKSMNFVRI